MKANVEENSEISTVVLPELDDAGDESSRRVVSDRATVLRGVSVRVCAVLGTKEITVGQLCDLKGGDVLELDQDVQAPIELHAEGQLVGRGELVVVGDNLGVRITELAPINGK